MHRPLIVIAIGVLMLSGCAREDLSIVMESVSPESVMTHVRILAHDSLQGRGSGTAGGAKAAAYLAEQLQSYGLEPAGENGSFYQKVAIVGQTLASGSFAEVRKGAKTVPLRQRDDIVLFSGAPAERVDLPATEVVFVGYGVVAPEQGWDDYKGMDVRGKVLLFLNNDPPSDDPAVFGGKARTYYGRWTYKYDIAAQKGAAGAIVIHTDTSAGYPWSVVANSWGGETMMLASEAEGSPLKLKAWTTDRATRDLLKLAGKELEVLIAAAGRKDFRPVPLGVTIRARLNLGLSRTEGTNVIARLPGSDEKLAREAVVFTSHHDHFGIGFPVKGDSIYNGALDNASGVSMTLELARAFARLPEKPKRSLLFAFVTAEEQGLLGSKYLATRPTMPLGDMAALFNIDGFNIYGKTNDVTFLGHDRSTLGADLDAVAKEMRLRVSPDPFPEQGYFYRSDHFSFAKVGIPCLSMDSGSDYAGKPATYAKEKSDEYTTQRYHQPSDQLSDDWPWNLDGMMQQFEVVARLTFRVGNAAGVPAWIPGDEFEAARKASRP